MRTRIKICGLTRAEDINAAVNAGCDAVGFVFYPPSPRAISIDKARELRQLLPAFVDCVALVVNASEQKVNDIIKYVQPDLLQFHGDETPGECQRFQHRYLRAFRLGGPETSTASDVLKLCLQYPDASGWLLDSYSGQYGGSGLAFKPQLASALLEHSQARPLIVAGGLTSDTVGPIIKQLRPYAVDISSGVEDRPGLKSASKIRQFINATNNVQRQAV